MKDYQNTIAKEKVPFDSFSSKDEYRDFKISDKQKVLMTGTTKFGITTGKQKADPQKFYIEHESVKTKKI